MPEKRSARRRSRLQLLRLLVLNYSDHRTCGPPQEPPPPIREKKTPLPTNSLGLRLLGDQANSQLD